MPTPTRAVTIGSPARDERAEHDEQHDRRDDEADGLAAADDLGHPGAIDEREVDLDAVDRRRRKAAMSASLVSFGTAVAGASNMTAATAALPSSETRRTPDARSRSVAPASSLWLSVASRSGAASISACLSLMVAQPASMSA